MLDIFGRRQAAIPYAKMPFGTHWSLEFPVFHIHNGSKHSSLQNLNYWTASNGYEDYIMPLVVSQGSILIHKRKNRYPWRSVLCELLKTPIEGEHSAHTVQYFMEEEEMVSFPAYPF